MGQKRKNGAKWAAAFVGLALAGAAVASANDETGEKVGETATSESVATETTADVRKDDEARTRQAVEETVSATVDEPEKLRRLDKTAPIWVSTDRKRVVLGGVVCLREGPLEFFACRRGKAKKKGMIKRRIQQ